MSNNLDPQDEADRVRSKRLAKLTSNAGPSASPSSPSTSAAPSESQTPILKPKLTPAKRPASPLPAAKSTTPVRRPPGPAKFDLQTWEDETVGYIFGVTLNREHAEREQWIPVWLKHLQLEIESEEPTVTHPIKLNSELADRLLIARLEVDPHAMADDLDYLPVLASLPPQQTVFEYLVGCWKRHNSAKAMLSKKNYSPLDVQRALAVLEKLKKLILGYAGLTLQEPDTFRQPPNVKAGASELIESLLSLSSLSDPLHSGTSKTVLSPQEVPLFLNDLAQFYESSEDELIVTLGPVIEGLLWHQSLWLPEGLGGADAGWRRVVGGMEALIGIKPIACIVPKLPSWNPPQATAANFEKVSLLGPLIRLSVFSREWQSIATGYFSEADKRSKADIDSSTASLRGTLKSFQSSLFQIFNAMVRASSESRESVLSFFSRVISLNIRRGGMQVEFDTVASDGFMVNVQSILLRFAEPFIDAKYSKIDRIDPLYLARSSRVDVKDETRIKATSEEVTDWMKSIDPQPTPNFISDIFYLTAAINHYGLNRTIQTFDEMQKHIDDMQRHLDHIAGDNSWQGTPLQARTQAAIDATKNEMSKIHAEQFACQVQLLDQEFIFRQIGFTNFLETWLIRLVDPRKAHPSPTVDVPLPQEIPTMFKMLPEYFLEDVVDYLLFIMRHSPMSFDLSGKDELLLWALTFLRSTWYIKNPFLKAKMNEVLFCGTLGFGREPNGVLGNLLNTHPFALKHLMPAMMSFYIEVEQTGASSQFYDKFNARRNIAFILKAIWTNPSHRQALSNEAQNVDKFVRFINLMINDVTYLMDESLSEMQQIANIEHEIDQPEWQTKSLQYRRERESTLRNIERHASGYTTLGRSTVDLLKLFTAETKHPFMVPEIVDKLAAMLNYNLEVLAGPKCTDLKVKKPEKYRFNPRALLSDILQVYLNLSDQGEFSRAVANDGRSYKKEIFESAARIARTKALKTEPEIEQLRLFVVKVEEMKATIEAEEDLGEIPDEYLDPLMFTVMRDPVILPSSRAVVDRSTIKSHLLSDTKDPFNRMPLSLEDVVSDTDLKERIQTFLAQRRNKDTALDIPEEDVVRMDTS